MFRLFMRYFLSMVFAAGLGFTGVHYALYKAPPWRREATVELNVTIRGTQGQPVPNAELFLFSPEKRFIGKTDARGEFKDEVLMRRGQVAILEAQGPTYRIRKDIPIPRLRRFRADVRLDPREARLGHMTLISKTLEEMSSGIASGKGQPTPRTVVPEPSASNPTPPAIAKSPLPQPSPLTGATRTEAPPAVVPPTVKGPVSLEVSNEASRPEHRLEEVFERLGHLVETMGEELSRNGISHLILRPLVASPDTYFELVGLGKGNAVVVSALFKSSLIDESFLARVMTSLGKKSGSRPLAAGQLIVHTTRPQRARAYLNGVQLPAKVFSDRVEFQFISIKGNATHVALAATADERPLVRKVALKEILSRTVEWTLPEPSLSRR